MSCKLNKELERLLGAFCEEAPVDATYPYMVFSAKRLSDDGEKQVFNLEVNVWDQHFYYSRAESMMDELEKKLHRYNYMTDQYLIRIFKGLRQTIADNDKSIKRVREQFELYVYEREGQT